MMRKAMLVAAILFGAIWGYLVALAPLGCESRVEGVDDGRVDRYSNGFRIGSEGTKVSGLNVGTIDFADATTGALAVTGAAPGDTYTAAWGWTDLDREVIYTTYTVGTNQLIFNHSTASGAGVTGQMRVIVFGTP